MSTQPAESGEEQQWQQPSFSDPEEPPAPRPYPAAGAPPPQQQFQAPAYPEPQPPYPPSVQPAVNPSLVPQEYRPQESPLIASATATPPPPSRLETVIEIALRAIWPIWAVLVFFGPLDLNPSLAITVIATIVLGILKRTLRERRVQARPTPPSQGPRELR